MQLRSELDEPEGKTPHTLRDRFLAVRQETERRAAPLSDEDQLLQSMPDASPAKWHRAHTTWFFEEFVLVRHEPDYQRVDARLSYLFNSYYVAAGPRFARPKRGLISRPSVAEIGLYRATVDRAMTRLLTSDRGEEIAPLVEIGLNHEQQHQELFLTDIVHAFSENPLRPAYADSWIAPPRATDGPDWIEFPETIATIGHATAEFAYDNEGPAHRTLLPGFLIRRGLVTNGDWLAFMEDGGYRTQSLWLNDGWAVAEQQDWHAPGYWEECDGTWHQFTLAGLRPIDPQAPVVHVSYYEADAFARWAGRHLPSEFEWEHAAKSHQLLNAYDVAWQWTRSAYAPYPGYRAAEGALGEYNGKFMINQMVLRGGSHATPHGHTRATYRNFFYPTARWQFTGVRLADA